jgi:hypothetical protein
MPWRGFPNSNTLDNRGELAIVAFTYSKVLGLLSVSFFVLFQDGKRPACSEIIELVRYSRSGRKGMW